ncbi:MAG: hypothetical protein RIS09_1242, partial [Actinomycetota bacterium]
RGVVLEVGKICAGVNTRQINHGLTIGLIH